MKDWGNKRGNLDAIMMETRFDQLTLVIDKFKTINGDKSLVDVFSDEFIKDRDKLNAYKQLGKSDCTCTKTFAPPPPRIRHLN